MRALALVVLASATAHAAPHLGPRGAPIGLPAVGADGIYAAPLEEQDGGSESLGRGVQFVRPDGTSDVEMVITYKESAGSGVWADNAPRVRREVPGRVDRLNERLAGFETLPRPVLHRDAVSDERHWKVRSGALLLDSNGTRLTVTRDAEVLVTHMLPTKADRNPKSCPRHRAWLAAVYVDEAHHALLLHHVYEGGDVCAEPIDDWVALPLPLPLPR